MKKKTKSKVGTKTNAKGKATKSKRKAKVKPTTKYLQRFRDWVFTPPYNGVPWVVWFYVMFACACYPHGGVFVGHLSGFDDHVRMTQVLNWINGAGWYDRTIMRANPPEGFTTIWTRIVDIPIATVVVLAQIFTDQRKAALIASIVVPFAELGLLFPVARYFARPLVGKDKAWLIVLFLMFTTVLNYKGFSIGGFNTGEASHHPWYTILDLALFGAAARIVLGAGSRPALIMGSAIGLLLAVGIEGFPMIACACGLIGILAWLDNRPVLARRGGEAMLVGTFASFLLLPMHQPPAHLFDISFAEPSMLGPIIIAMAAVFFGLEHFVLTRIGHRKEASLIIIVMIAGLIAVLLATAFPQMLDGAAAGLSPVERQMALAEHYEAMPVHRVMKNMTLGVIGTLGVLMPTIIAVIVGAFAAITTTNRRRRALRIAYFGFAAFSGGMSEIFSRYMHHAMTTACVWLLWIWENITARLPRNRSFSLASLATFIVLGPLWMLLLPAFQSDAPVLSQVLLFPAKVQAVQDPCDITYITWYINEHYSKDTLLIVPNWDSSRFLYHTDVRINFVANYPSHDKFIDNENFFQTNDLSLAKNIARRHDLDLVAVCRLPMVFNRHYPMDKQLLLGLLQVSRPPAWLKPVDISDLPGNYALYSVDKAALDSN